MVTYLIYRLEAKVFILRNWNFINTERDSDKMLLSFLRFKGGNPVLLLLGFVYEKEFCCPVLIIIIMETFG